MTKSKKRILKDKILDIMKSKCTDTTRLISEDMDRPRTALRWLKVGFHLALCEYCQEYKTQLETLRKLTQGLEIEVPSMDIQGEMKLESKEKLRQMIERNS